MKKLILILAIVLPVAVLAQKNPVDGLFEKYGNKKGFTTVNISGKLLGLAAKMDSTDASTSEMLSKLNSVRILTVDDKVLAGNINFFEELDRGGFFKNHKYEVLMEITETDEVVRFLARDDGKGKFSDLILVVSGDDNTIISISGIIDPEKIGALTNSLNIDLGN